MTGHSTVKFDEHWNQGGRVSVVDVPFEIKRCYAIYSMSNSTVHGGYAHRRGEQLIIAAHGGFEVSLDNGFEVSRHYLADPSIGLYIAPMVWRVLTDFSDNAVALVFTSTHDEESNRFRDHGDFLRAVRRTHNATDPQRLPPDEASAMMGGQP